MMVLYDIGSRAFSGGVMKRLAVGDIMRDMLSEKDVLYKVIHA